MTARGMRPGDVAELLALAALWGASFLFMRLGAADFGAVALSGLRVAGAALLLLPVLAASGQAGALRAHWRPIAIVGVVNSAAPFVLFSYAALSINAGLSAIFNASSALFAAAIGWAWLRERQGGWRLVGLALGMLGVVALAGDKASFNPGGTGWAVLACIGAAVLYGFAAQFTRRKLQGVPPMAVATGSQLAAALMLAGPTVLAWPAVMPPAGAWAAMAVLSVACTGLAYILYFRLIAHIGPGRAISVTFLIPLFAMTWGAIFLGEAVTPAMAAGCAVILAGTALANGLWPRLEPSGGSR